MVRDTQALAYWGPSTLYFILATGAQTNNAFSLVKQIIYKQGWTSTQQRCAQDRGIYVLKGQCTVKMGPERSITARANDFIAIPKLTQHSLTVDHANTELLDFYTPAGYGQIIMGILLPALEPGPPPADLSLASTHQTSMLYSQYGFHNTESASLEGIRDTLPSSKTVKSAPASAIVPFHANGQSAPAYWVIPAIPELWIQLASGDQTGDSYTLTEMLLTKGNAAAPMKYGNRDETYYILEGQATFFLGDRIEEAGTGDFVFIPRETVFGLRIDSDKVRALIWHTPSGIIEGALPFLGGVPAENRTSPPTDLERPSMDLQKFMEHARSLQIHVLAIPDPLK